MELLNIATLVCEGYSTITVFNTPLIEYSGEECFYLPNWNETPRAIQWLIYNAITQS
jgi:hypothetical protein